MIPTTSDGKHLFGWIKDPYKSTDFVIRSAKRPGDIPKTSLMMDIIPAVWDQSQQGSCTGQGIGGILTGSAIQLGYMKEAKFNPTIRFSPRWLYYLGRKAINTVYEDSGAYARDIFDAVLKVGCALEEDWPYPPPPSIFEPAYALPPASCVKSASEHLILVSFVRVVDGVDGICTALGNGKLVTLGAPWFAKWENPGPEGKLATIKCWDAVAGGHQTFLYGHTYFQEVFYLQNSWGNQWANHGRCTLPFSVINQFKKKGGYDAHTVTIKWIV